jgi:hypothetical protein
VRLASFKGLDGILYAAVAMLLPSAAACGLQFWVQESAAEMLCERKNIAASIKDTDSVVNSLETGLGMLIHFIFIALYLLVWGVNIVQGFTTFSATALALTFVFGDSVKGVFEVSPQQFELSRQQDASLLCHQARAAQASFRWQ